MEYGPKEALQLLDRLEGIGFGDAAFSRLHHFRKTDWAETIGSFRGYCLRRSSFTPGNNRLVVERLRYVLDEYGKAGLPPGDAKRFEELAEDAYRLIPPP